MGPLHFESQALKFLLLPQDKANHVIYGAVVSSLSAAAVLAAGVTPVSWTPLIAMASATATGVIKEVMDHRANKLADKQLLVRPHSVEPLDVAWTAAGGAPAAFLTWRLLVALGF